MRKGDSMHERAKNKTARLAELGLLCAAALILSYVESLIPFFPGIPGMKLGLANAAVVTVLYLFSWREALAVNAVRILAVSLLFGNVFSLLFSAAGAALSLLVMQLAKRSGALSTAGVSMLGGIAHNAGQLLVAMMVMENLEIGFSFFALGLCGTATGLAIGVTAGLITERIRKARQSRGS